MTPKSPQYKRRNYYIDKDFQTKFILKFCSLIAFSSALTVGLIYWMAQQSTTVGISNGHVAVHTTAEYLLPLLLQTVFAELLIVATAAVFLTLFVSHKIAGPLFRLKAVLGTLGEGDLAPMKLREGDQLQQVAVHYNEAVGKMAQKIKKAKSASSLDEARNILDTFKT